MLIMNIYSGVQYDRVLFRIAHTVQVMQGTSKNFCLIPLQITSDQIRSENLINLNLILTRLSIRSPRLTLMLI